MIFGFRFGCRFDEGGVISGYCWLNNGRGRFGLMLGISCCGY